MHLLSQLLFILSPISLVVAGYAVLMWREGEFRRRSPLEKTRVLRYPGYSLGQRVKRLDERLNLELLMLLLIPAITVVAASSLPRDGGRWMLALAYFGGVAWTVWQVFRTIREGRNCNLGLRGEQVVGHTLSGLLEFGFQVFHDVPLDKGGNIDHVAVGPPGVFAIETKWYRKLKDDPEGHIVKYDGRTLTFPNEKPRSRELDQARRQAETLKRLLGGAVSDPSVIRPVLVLPGWYVKFPDQNSEVRVLNQTILVKQLATSHSAGAGLAPSQIDAISLMLRDRCCDVEV